MSNDHEGIALAGCGMGCTRAFAPCAPSIVDQALGTDDIYAYGRAGTRGGDS